MTSARPLDALPSEAARAAERTQVAAQQRAMAAQLQELRASQAALRTQVTQLEAEVAKRDRWLDGLAKPRGGGALGALVGCSGGVSKLPPWSARARPLAAACGCATVSSV